LNVIEIRPLTHLDLEDLRRLIAGYVSNMKYQVSLDESDDRFALTLQIIPLETPYVKRYDHLDEPTLQHYAQLPHHGLSFGAYEAGRCVGVALTEPRAWNKSLWVWEFHVEAAHRRRGIGRQLMGMLTERGRAAGMRTVVCETQNTNVPAIRFYRKLGFRFEGIDLSYYSNHDFPDGEIAIFMKKQLE
jgi:ribosomal protein S18 acetylase RimI-like enzyme